MITEISAKLNVKKVKVVSREMEVFYNPVMQFNRTSSILMLNSLGNPIKKAALPMAGSGIRAIRMLKELNPGLISEIHINDISPTAIKKVKENFKLNKIPIKRAVFHNMEASQFMLKNKVFDYVDIDPFGSPNQFLDAGIRSLRNNAVFAVTATDTAPLSGTYPKTCMRKYWAEPIRNEHMHEIGLRILIRKIMLVAAQYEVSLKPLLSYSKDHYFRVFFLAERGKKRADEQLHKIGYFLYCKKCCDFKVSQCNLAVCCNHDMMWAGPLFTGRISDSKLLKKMLSLAQENDKKFLKTLYNESQIDLVGFYDVHRIAKVYRFKSIPSHAEILSKLDKRGIKYAISHTKPTGIKVNMKIKEFVKILK